MGCLILDPRGLFQSIGQLAKLANKVWVLCILKSLWLSDVDLSINGAIQEGGFDIQGVDFEIMGNCNGEESSENGSHQN